MCIFLPAMAIRVPLHPDNKRITITSKLKERKKIMLTFGFFLIIALAAVKAIKLGQNIDLGK